MLGNSKPSTDQQNQKHRIIITDFVRYVCKITHQFVLRGSSALALCYNGERVISRVHWDGFEPLLPHIESYCKIKGYRFEILSETSLCLKVRIYYAAKSYFDIMTDYKLKTYPRNDAVAFINKVWVYDIDELLVLKLMKYLHNHYASDLYDVMFIWELYKVQMSSTMNIALREMISNTDLRALRNSSHNSAGVTFDQQIFLKRLNALINELGLKE